MKKFIFKTFHFVSIFIFFLFLLIFSTNKIIKKKSNFKISRDIKNIIVGHSHSECAYNDTLILGFKNFSLSGEGYFYNFFKLKELIKQNSQIKNIFIEFTNNQIGKKMEKWIWGKEYVSYRFIQYAPFMNIRDHELIIRHNSISYFSNLSALLKNNFIVIIKGAYNYSKSEKIGRFKWLIRNKTDSLVTVFKSTPPPIKRQLTNEISKTNIKYLKKIVSLCKEKGVNVYFIRSPQHKYANRKNEKELLKIKEKEFKEIEFLDFDKFPLNNGEFGDFEHLNYKGAKVFSIWFNHLIKIGLLTSNNKQNFINKKIRNLLKSNNTN